MKNDHEVDESVSSALKKITPIILHSFGKDSERDLKPEIFHSAYTVDIFPIKVKKDPLFEDLHLEIKNDPLKHLASEDIEAIKLLVQYRAAKTELDEKYFFTERSLLQKKILNNEPFQSYVNQWLDYVVPKLPEIKEFVRDKNPFRPRLLIEYHPKGKLTIILDKQEIKGNDELNHRLSGYKNKKVRIIREVHHHANEYYLYPYTKFSHATTDSQDSPFSENTFIENLDVGNRVLTVTNEIFQSLIETKIYSQVKKNIGLEKRLLWDNRHARKYLAKVSDSFCNFFDRSINGLSILNDMSNNYNQYHDFSEMINTGIKSVVNLFIDYQAYDYFFLPLLQCLMPTPAANIALAVIYPSATEVASNFFNLFLPLEIPLPYVKTEEITPEFINDHQLTEWSNYRPLLTPDTMQESNLHLPTIQAGNKPAFDSLEQPQHKNSHEIEYGTGNTSSARAWVENGYVRAKLPITNNFDFCLFFPTIDALKLSFAFGKLVVQYLQEEFKNWPLSHEEQLRCELSEHIDEYLADPNVYSNDQLKKSLNHAEHHYPAEIDTFNAIRFAIEENELDLLKRCSQKDPKAIHELEIKYKNYIQQLAMNNPNKLLEIFVTDHRVYLINAFYKLENTNPDFEWALCFIKSAITWLKYLYQHQSNSPVYQKTLKYYNRIKEDLENRMNPLMSMMYSEDKKQDFKSQQTALTKLKTKNINDKANAKPKVLKQSVKPKQTAPNFLVLTPLKIKKTDTVIEYLANVRRSKTNIEHFKIIDVSISLLQLLISFILSSKDNGPILHNTPETRARMARDKALTALSIVISKIIQKSILPYLAHKMIPDLKQNSTFSSKSSQMLGGLLAIIQISNLYGPEITEKFSEYLENNPKVKEKFYKTLEKYPSLQLLNFDLLRKASLYLEGVELAITDTLPFITQCMVSWQNGTMSSMISLVPAVQILSLTLCLYEYGNRFSGNKSREDYPYHFGTTGLNALAITLSLSGKIGSLENVQSTINWGLEVFSSLPPVAQTSLEIAAGAVVIGAACYGIHTYCKNNQIKAIERNFYLSLEAKKFDEAGMELAKIDKINGKQTYNDNIAYFQALQHFQDKNYEQVESKSSEFLKRKTTTTNKEIVANFISLKLQALTGSFLNQKEDLTKESKIAEVELKEPEIKNVDALWNEFHELNQITQELKSISEQKKPITQSTASSEAKNKDAQQQITFLLSKAAAQATEKGDFANALIYYDKIISIEPSADVTEQRRACDYHNDLVQSHHSELETKCLHQLKIVNSQDTVALKYLGISFFQQNKLKSSTEYFQKLSDIKPEDPEPPLYLSRIERSQSLVKAKEYSKKAVFLADSALKKHLEAKPDKPITGDDPVSKSLQQQSKIAHEKLTKAFEQQSEQAHECERLVAADITGVWHSAMGRSVGNVAAQTVVETAQFGFSLWSSHSTRNQELDLSLPVGGKLDSTTESGAENLCTFSFL